MNPSYLKRQGRTLTTLALVLVVVVCQLFGDIEQSTVHYSDNSPPFGTQVSHAHDRHEHHCDCCPSSDHAHADHVHCSCHPPSAHYAVIASPRAESIPFEKIHYRGLGYAPALPPPNT